MNLNLTPALSRRTFLRGAGALVALPVLDTRLKASSRREFTVRVTAALAAKPGVQLIAFDITRDGQRHGELFDAILELVP